MANLPAPFRLVRELRQTREGVPFSSDMVRTYTRRWLVIVTDNAMGAGKVCSAPGLPRPYSPYLCPDGAEFDLLSLAIRASAEMVKADDSRAHWIVTIDYSTQMPEGGPSDNVNLGWEVGGAQNNPEMEPWDLEWDFEEARVAPAKDLNSIAYLNSARQPFKPAPTFEQGRATLVIVRNQLDITRETMTGMCYAVNSDRFLRADPGTVLCLPPRAKLMFRGRQAYWRVTWRLKFNRPKPKPPGNLVAGLFPDPLAPNFGLPVDTGELESWQPEILDQGLCHLQIVPGLPLTGHPVPIFRQGHPVTQPVLLDGNGQPAQPNINNYIEPVFLRFKQFQPRPFGSIFERGLRGIV